MFGLIVILNVVSVAANRGQATMGYAVASLVAAIFAMGIASNFRSDRMSMPNYAVYMSQLSGLAGISLAVIGFIK